MRTILVAAVAGAALAAACQGGGGTELLSTPPRASGVVPPSVSSSSIESPAQSPTVSGSRTTPAPGASPASVLPPIPGVPSFPALPGASLSSGQAHVDVAGAVEASLELTLRSPAVYAPPPGGFALTFADEQGSAFALGGVTFAGSKESSQSLVVALNLPARQAFYVSAPGDCRVTFTRANAEGAAGTVSCSGLVGPQGTVDLQARFSVSS